MEGEKEIRPELQCQNDHVHVGLGNKVIGQSDLTAFGFYQAGHDYHDFAQITSICTASADIYTLGCRLR